MSVSFSCTSAADSHVALGTTSCGDITVGHSNAKTKPGQAPDTVSPCPCRSQENFPTEREATISFCLKRRLDLTTLSIHTIYTHLRLPRTQQSLR